jgi:predicted Zn-dependent protease
VKTIQPLSALLEMSPVDPAALHYQLADALLADGQPNLARRHVLWALENAPRYRDAQRLLLQLSDEAGQNPEAPVEKTNSTEK